MFSIVWTTHHILIKPLGLCQGYSYAHVLVLSLHGAEGFAVFCMQLRANKTHIFLVSMGSRSHLSPGRSAAPSELELCHHRAPPKNSSESFHKGLVASKAQDQNQLLQFFKTMLFTRWQQQQQQ